jgi:OPA family sugar phosphate sensor protein UhpC-like MFS transporter
MVAVGGHEHLSLVAQAAKADRMDDAVAVALKRVAGAALGMVGVFSYLGAGIQDQVTGILLDGGKTVVGGVAHHDFESAILFWIGASVISLVLAATLWRTKLRD